MSLGKALSVAENGRESALSTLRGLVSQPSISARDEGIEDCNAILRDIMDEVGIKTRLLPTAGHPAIYGEIEGPPGAPTILFYGHYDVQPPEPLELWHSPPFLPTVRDGRIYGRGVADNKGQHLCHVLAVGAWREASRDLPATVKFLFEGEEETGSPHMSRLIEENRDLLSADVVYTSDGGMHPSGTPAVYFGVRGLLYVEVEVAGASSEAHSGNKGNILPQPAWELVDLLYALRGSDGRPAFEGFYDAVRTPTPEQEAALRRMPFDRAGFLDEHGLDDTPIGDGADYYRRLTLEPTFNIAGLVSGYTGEGTKTIIPSRALAKIDFRLVPDQDPEDVYDAFVGAVGKLNPDATVRKLGTMEPSATDPALPVCRDVVRAVEDSWGVPPVESSLGGSLPDYVFTRILGAPSVIVPYANHDAQNHAPDENLRLDCFFAGIRTTLHVLHTMGNSRAHESGK